MEQTPNIPPAEVNDEAQLDKELEDSLSSIRGENKVEVKPQPEVAKKEDVPSSEAATEPPNSAPTNVEPKPNADDPQPPASDGYKVPVKGKFESEESYQKRLDLAELVKQRKTARTEEEKQRLSGAIANTRKELSTLNNANNINNPDGGKPADTPAKPGDKDEKLEADLARLKELGGATKEDIEAVVQQHEQAREIRSTLQTFVDRHPELKNDEDAREVFFDFVDSNYKWDDKSGKELMTILELARESMFKPSETIQERVLTGANVQEKVNAMQFPGGTIAKPGLTPDQQKSVDEMKAAGMSEEKALELISE